MAQRNYFHWDSTAHPQVTNLEGVWCVTVY